MPRIIRRVLTATIVVLCLIGSGQSAEGEQQPTQLECIPRAQCCKVCNKGQACGNTCISRKYNCTKGRGCACDAAEVCN